MARMARMGMGGAAKQKTEIAEAEMNEADRVGTRIF
jgi:hypothetical protein